MNGAKIIELKARMSHLISKTIDFQIFQETPYIHLGSMNLK